MDKKLVLEIGIHRGWTLTEMATDHPRIGFVGLDITLKRVVTSAQRAQNQKLDNVLCVLSDAKFLGEIFEPGEGDGVVIFFPDPWEKKRSQKHKRLMNKEFIEGVEKFLKIGGFFWFKTDCKEYFEQVTELVAEAPFQSANRDMVFKRDYSSAFESRYLKQNKQVYEGFWISTVRPDEGADNSYMQNSIIC